MNEAWSADVTSPLEAAMRRTLNAVGVAAVTALAGCYSLPVTATVVTQPGTRVTAEASKLNPFWLSPLPENTSAELLDDLLQQCGGKGLTGVTIGTKTAWVIIGQQEKIVASGYCVEKK
jgi:hypothetical protein